MVAAPETIVQETAPVGAASGESAVSNGKLASLDNGKGQDKEAHEGHSGNHSGTNGVDDLTVADIHPPKNAHRASSHNNNFDPTLAAVANLPPPDIARHIPCRFFPLGTCKYGDQCAFSHGLPGVAGSPGVASVAVPGLHQNQSEEYSQEGQVNGGGAPMYYPEQGYEYGAYAAHFAPQQGYQPFPHYQQYPQHYQPGLPPQAYYQSPPPPQMMVDPAAANGAPVTSSSPNGAASTSPVPTSPSAAPLSPSFSSPPPASHGLPLAPGPPASYAPYPPQPFSPQQADFASFPPQQAPSSSPPTTFGPDGTPLRSPPTQSLHTFFQTSSAPTSLPLAPSSAPFAKGPHQPIGGFRRPVVGPGAFGPKKPFPFASKGKTHCSFFEANRCKHGDDCMFFHLLPDGKDARQLGQGIIGIDGRTDNPERNGGIPPLWKQNAAAFQNAKASGRPMMHGVGGYGGMPRDMKPRFNRFEEEQHHRHALAASQSGPVAPVVAPVEREESKSSESAAPAPASEASEPKATRIPPGSSTPTLVAAIQGLTRRIPPATSQAPATNGAGPTRAPKQPHHAQQQPAAQSQAAQQTRQKLPSNDDFPALSTPSSPPLETTNPTTPVAEVLKTISRAASPTRPTDAPAAATPVSPPAPAPSTPSLAEVVAAEAPTESSRHVPSRSETSESDFVIVTHAEATPPPATPTAASTPTPEPTSTTEVAATEASVAPAAPASATPPAAPAATPAPRVMGSFASAAARGAAIPTPIVPERRRPAVVVAPVKVEKEEVKEAGTGASKKRKNKANRGENKDKAGAAVAPVAVKA